MSRTTTTHAETLAAPGRADIPVLARPPVHAAAEVATVLARMTYTERVRAYRSGALSAHELAVAAAWFPDQVPILNGELEWIAVSLVDNE
jgi:hypothetical protein